MAEHLSSSYARKDQHLSTTGTTAAEQLASCAKSLQEIEAEMLVDGKRRRESDGCETDRAWLSFSKVPRS
jgi:hypothetical protein